MSKDIKMADGEWLVDDHTIYTLKSNGAIDFWLQVSRSGYSGNQLHEYTVGITDKLNSHDTLTQQVAELRAALRSIKEHQKVVAPSGYEFSTVWSLANKALKESE